MDEFTDSSTCCGPTAIVQSGGNQPVVGMPAKLVDPLGAATGSSPGSSAAVAIARALSSSLFRGVSLLVSAVTLRNLAFGAASLRAWNFSFEIG
jgi:hypothetical protein